MPQVTVIIVEYRSAGLTLDLLASLPLGPGVSAVVVDNDPGSGFAAACAGRQFGGPVTVVESDVNDGFTGGLNRAAAIALAQGAEVIWLLNPDVTVGPGVLDELLAVLEASGAAAVSPLVEERAGVWAGELSFAREFAGPWDLGKPKPRKDRWWRSGRYHGACALFDARAVHRVSERDGHFQAPGFFMYWDEWECSARLGRTPVAIAGQARVFHAGVEELDAPRRYYLSRNALLAGRAVAGRWQTAALTPARIARDLRGALRMKRAGGSFHVGAYFAGLRDGLAGRSGRRE